MELSEFVYKPEEEAKKIFAEIVEEEDSSDEVGDASQILPRDYVLEKRNASLTVVIGLTSFLITLVCMVLAWVLHARHSNGTFLALAIVLIFMLIFVGYCIYWGLKTIKDVSKKRVPNPITSSVVFFASLFLTGYCFVVCMMLTFYKAIHYDYLIGLYTHKEKWQEIMPGSSFDTVWRQNKAIIVAISILLLVLGLSFLFFSYTASSVSYNRYYKIRDSLYFALILMTIAAWGGLHWSIESYEKLDFIDNEDAVMMVRFMRIITIVAICLSFVNGLVNFAKFKWAYFMFAFINVLLLIMVVICSAATWREVRKEQFKERSDMGTQSCITTMYTIHETKINTWCNINGGKYLNPPNTCGKAFLATRWESDQLGEIRSLNPACCLSAKHYYIWPYMMMAFFGTILMLANAMVAIFDLYLSDSTFFMGVTIRKRSKNDYLGIGVITALNLFFILWFTLSRDNDPEIHSRAAYYNSFLYPEVNSIAGWDTVPGKLLKDTNPSRTSGSSIGSVCYPYDTSILPDGNFDTVNSDCSRPEICTIRLAIALLDGAKFSLISANNQTAKITENRYTFFPNCAFNISDYLMFRGSESEIKDILKYLKICPNSTIDLPRILVYKDQVNSSTLGFNGLANGESFSQSESNQDYSLCGRGFDKDTCAIQPCKVQKVLSDMLVFRTLKGRLFYINNGQLVHNVPNTLIITASDSAGVIPTTTKIYQNGLFSIEKVALYRHAPYILRLEINDLGKEFLSSQIDVVIDPRFGDEPTGENIMLNTADGLVCPPGNKTICLESKRLKYGRIAVITNDGSSSASSSQNKRLSDIRVRLHKGKLYQGDEILSVKSDALGVAVFDNIPYGSYSLTVMQDGYKPSVQFIDLQEPNLNPTPFHLNPSTTDFDLKVVADMVITASDYDLIVQMKTTGGIECEVSPYSKYCPYSFHSSDVTTGPGEESIILKKLAVATYNAYVQQSPPYDAKCNSYEFMKANAYHYGAVSLSWSHIQSSSDMLIYPGMIEPRLSTGILSKELTLIEQLMASVQPSQVIESASQAMVEKIVVNLNGMPLPTSKQYRQSTYFIEQDRTADNNKTASKRENKPDYIFVLCVNPPTEANSCLNGSAFVQDKTSKKQLGLVDYYLDTSKAKSHVEVYTNKTRFTNGFKIDSSLLQNSSLFSEDNRTVNLTIYGLEDVGFLGRIKNNQTSQQLTSFKNGTKEQVNSTVFNVTIPNIVIQSLVEHGKSTSETDKNTSEYRLVNTTSMVGIVDIVAVTANTSKAVDKSLVRDSQVEEKLTYHNGSKGVNLLKDWEWKDGKGNWKAVEWNIQTIDHTSGLLKKREVTRGVYNESKNSDTFNYFNYSEANSSIIEEYIRDAWKSGPGEIERQNNISRNYTISYSNDAGVETTSCRVLNRTDKEYLTNHTTSIDRVTINRKCEYRNGSSVVVGNSSFMQSCNISGSLTYLNNTNLTILVTYANGTTQNFNTSQPTGSSNPAPGPTRRRVLAKYAGHQAENGSTSAPTTFGGKYIWVSCFTGFGEASAIFINSIQNVKPSLAACEDRIRKERPKFTAEKLKEAILKMNS